jgi:hypothetical protein
MPEEQGLTLDKYYFEIVFDSVLDRDHPSTRAHVGASSSNGTVVGLIMVPAERENHFQASGLEF